MTRVVNCDLIAGALMDALRCGDKMTTPDKYTHSFAWHAGQFIITVRHRSDAATRTWYDPQGVLYRRALASPVVAQASSQRKRTGRRLPTREAMLKRDAIIVEMVANGKTRNEIARRLGLMPQSLCSYLHNNPHLPRPARERNTSDVNAERYLAIRGECRTLTEVAMRMGVSPATVTTLKKKYG